MAPESSKGTFLYPEENKEIECYDNASFVSVWCTENANNVSNVLSCTEYITYYVGCPTHWCSKMKSKIASSTAKAEYIVLLQAMRETIPFMIFMTKLDIIFPFLW